MSSTLALACQLMALPSQTPFDAGCQALLGERLAALGFSLERFNRNGVDNLWARRGNTAPLICFAGHTDVVPPGPASDWHSPPFSPTLRDGMLYGRGAADMKGSLAAFIVAIEDFIAEQPRHPGSIALLITSDEEGPACDGTRHVVDALAARGERINWCIVGEPTSGERFGDTIKHGRRGSLSGELTVRGKQGHVAYPQLADNPLHRLAPALAELVACHWDAGDSDFPPTGFQLSNLAAGTGAGNVIPGHASLRFNFRYSPQSSAESLQQRVHAILDAHRLDYTLNWTHGAEPFVTPSGTLARAISDAIKVETGITPASSTSGGTSDGRFIKRIADELIEFGPCNATIHQANECIAATDLDRLARIYRHTLAILLR